MADDPDNQDIIDALKQPATGIKLYPGKGPTTQPDTPFANWAQNMGESGKESMVDLLKHPEHMVGTGELGALRLQPLGGIIPNKLQPQLQSRRYSFIDDRGIPVGESHIMYDTETKQLLPQPVSSYLKSPLPDTNYAKKLNPQSQSLGYSNMRSLVEALKQEYPKAKSIVGWKGSGAVGLGKDPPKYQGAPVEKKFDSPGWDAIMDMGDTAEYWRNQYHNQMPAVKDMNYAIWVKHPESKDFGFYLDKNLPGFQHSPTVAVNLRHGGVTHNLRGEGASDFDRVYSAHDEPEYKRVKLK